MQGAAPSLLLEFQKLLGTLAMPAGLVWLALLGLTVWLARRRQFLPFAGALAIWAAYGLAGNPYVGAALIARLERRVPPLPDQAPPFDAVFVLGGGTEVDPAGAPILGSAGDRVVQAARLWHAGRARTLVASGWFRDTVGGPRDGGQDTRALWRSLGVPEAAIVVVDEPCWITQDEIRAYARLKAAHGWKRTALLSSAWHLPRALVLAGKAGLDVTPVGADWRGRDRAFRLDGLVPQDRGFMLIHRAAWEALGRAMGR
ncbi:YdcF family protein [Mesoterricola sediminis]|uniref:Membrane protein n=1 Tax=Mesoterricola sediminis TaxID=2927980 RepID=A0AA48KCJ1_9BACT|nr:YdcF family protein [Mesoterricola sediminis]BDU76100.1 membrane protein [Mesoterricola sediminis]